MEEDNNDGKKKSQIIPSFVGISDVITKQLDFNKSITDILGSIRPTTIAQVKYISEVMKPIAMSPFIEGFGKQDEPIDIEDVLEDVSKLQKKLFLIEFIPLSNKDKIDSYFITNNGKSLVSINESRSKDSFQQSVKSLTLKVDLPNNVSHIEVHSVYNFGDYLTLIFECNLNLQEFNNGLTGDRAGILNKRYKIYEDLQCEIEKLIPKELHGFFFNNELKLTGLNPTLPSIYVYDFTDYNFIFDDSKKIDLTGSNTIRGKAERFLNEFNEYEGDDFENPKFNHLHHLGIRPKRLFAVIGKKLIVSQSEEYFQDVSKPIPRNYTVLCFDESSLFPFCMELVSYYHLFIMIENNLVLLKEFKLPKISDIKESSLEIKKKELLLIKARFDELGDSIFCYFNILDFFENLDFRFNDEETWTYSFGAKKGWNEYSISDYFKDYLLTNKNEIERIKQHLKKRIDDVSKLIQTELEIKRNKPVINPLYKEIEEELIQQIKKWENRISKEQMETWLSNFSDTTKRRYALRLLDKLIMISNKEFKPFLRATYNSLASKLNGEDKIIYSAIGKITSGSYHLLRPFQEENKLKEDLFKEFKDLKSDKKTILILVDDFIGSGNTFIKFYKKNEELLRGYKKVYYVCPISLKQGKDKIESELKLEVISAYILGDEYKVRNIFKETDKEEIQEFINGHKDRIPEEYLWGFDDCEALITFEDNIPNNTLGIFWYSKNWIPLIERK